MIHKTGIVRIALAGDRRLIHEGIRAKFAFDFGVEIIGECHNGQDAVTMAAELQPDVLVVDNFIPDLNSVDVTQKIVKMAIPTKILILSTNLDKQFVKIVIKAGASGYLLENSAEQELSFAVRIIKSGQVYVSKEIAEMIIGDYVAQAKTRISGYHSALTTREWEVLQLIAEGRSTRQISEHLTVSVKTVESHRKRLMDKLGIRHIPGLTKYAIREGISTLDS